MDFAKMRFNMVEQQIRPWDVLDFDVLDAMESVPREAFVLPEQRGYAYADMALRLGNGAMMLEPKIVARMVQGLALKKTDSVLEIGTGSGYATAVLANLAMNVHTLDTDETQLNFAKNVLDSLGYENIQYEHSNGFAVEGMFDAIYVGGAVSVLTEPLLQRLNPQGGRMVVVVGHAPVQRCVRVVRNGEHFAQTVLFDTLIAGLDEKSSAPSRFVF